MLWVVVVGVLFGSWVAGPRAWSWQLLIRKKICNCQDSNTPSSKQQGGRVAVAVGQPAPAAQQQQPPVTGGRRGRGQVHHLTGLPCRRQHPQPLPRATRPPSALVHRAARRCRGRWRHQARGGEATQLRQRRGSGRPAGRGGRGVVAVAGHRAMRVCEEQAGIMSLTLPGGHGMTHRHCQSGSLLCVAPLPVALRWNSTSCSDGHWWHCARSLRLAAWQCQCQVEAWT